MHQKVCLAFFCLLLVSNGRLEGGGGGLEPPMVPLRLLAGSLIEGCSICAESDMKKAFSMLGREYPPAAVFSSGPECAFIRPPNAVRASSFSRAIRPASLRGAGRQKKRVSVARLPVPHGERSPGGRCPRGLYRPGHRVKDRCGEAGGSFDASIGCGGVPLWRRAAFNYSPKETGSPCTAG